MGATGHLKLQFNKKLNCLSVNVTVDEFLIEKYFKNIGSKFLSKKFFIRPSDDSAVFKSTNNLCYSVDQNYEGIHFLVLYLPNL